MLELRDVFRRIGLKATGKRETLEGLIKGPYPAVAHLNGNLFDVPADTLEQNPNPAGPEAASARKRLQTVLDSIQ
ncbi:hypothetical protein ES703_63216 [subsurface metagenome]